MKKRNYLQILEGLTKAASLLDVVYIYSQEGQNKTMIGRANSEVWSALGQIRNELNK